MWSIFLENIETIEINNPLSITLDDVTTATSIYYFSEIFSEASFMDLSAAAPDLYELEINLDEDSNEFIISLPQASKFNLDGQKVYDIIVP